MQRWTTRLLPAVMLAVSGRISAAETGLPISLVNYSRQPVLAAAVTLDEKELDAKLGLPEGTPLAVHGGAGPAAAPIGRGADDGRAVVRLYVSPPPQSRLDLLARSADFAQPVDVRITSSQDYAGNCRRTTSCRDRARGTGGSAGPRASCAVRGASRGGSR